MNLIRTMTTVGLLFFPYKYLLLSPVRYTEDKKKTLHSKKLHNISLNERQPCNNLQINLANRVLGEMKCLQKLFTHPRLITKAVAMGTFSVLLYRKIHF